MSVCKFAYLNDQFMTAEEAAISPFDRGFLFAHAAYEVTAVYNGKLIDAQGHTARLKRTLSGISIPMPHSGEEIIGLHEELIAKNGLREGLIYLQVTAGAYGYRDFPAPAEIRPTVFMYADVFELIGKNAKNGISAIILEDTRWKRRDMKTTQLLSQALAYRTAQDAGAYTAWMVEDGFITEAASANTWIVDAKGKIITRDLSNAILAGVTRASVMKHLSEAGIQVEERAFTPEEALNAAEAFTTSGGAIISPVVSIDGNKIGSGTPGPVTRKIQKLYYQAIGADVSKIDWLG